MRIRKRSPPLPFSIPCPTIPPVFRLHKVPSPEERLEQSRKAGQEGAEEGRQKEAKAEGSSKPQQPNGGDPSSVAIKEEESTHLVHHQPQTQTSSNPFHPLPLNLKVNRHRPSSDLQLTIIRVKDGWICLDGGEGGGEGGEEPNTTQYESYSMYPKTPSQADEGLQGEEETKEKRWRVLFNNSRNASSVDAKANDEIGTNGLLSSSSNQVGRWCEGEKAFPLKKRKGSFNLKAIGETRMANQVKKMRTILKTKTNKRFFPLEDNQKDNEEDEDEDEEEEEEEEDRKEGLTTNNNGGRSKYNSMKKRGSRGVVMEGSRCSRMNGRGWRCCQSTLVGYSLCEHHLGKGRLRSMNTVRSHTRASSIIPELDKPMRSLSSSSSSSISKYEEEDLLDEDEDEEEKPLMRKMKRKKQIGMVKARSISSLLGTSSVVNGSNCDIV